jgi:hypothetical protein
VTHNNVGEVGLVALATGVSKSNVVKLYVWGNQFNHASSSAFASLNREVTLDVSCYQVDGFMSVAQL